MTGCKPHRLHIDLETYSSEDIGKTGVHRYVEADDFEILLLAYAWDDSPVQVLDLTGSTPKQLTDVIAGILDPETVKVAHNCAFERACLKKYIGRDLPPEEWEDTMIMAAMNGLPMSLDAAGAALNLKDQKIKEGTALISYFCKPCKPTIANGGRTRNLPEHAPEKWERFVEYCRRDVEVEQAIYYRLKGYPVTDFERKVWAVDARINERGVLIDTELAEAAIAVDEAFTAEHAAEMQRLTGLDNPNSVAQLKEWLAAVGVECESLNKSTVKDLHNDATDRTIKRVLELRQLLGKTSTTKYQAMTRAVCKDGRVRGLLQYYGAGRTGRWAGRLLQVQNLPQNHLNDIGTVRELVRARDLETLELVYDSVPDVLSQLIRTALIAKPGHTFLVADYSAIEARVIAYLAGEQWRMDVFEHGGDIYCSTASKMFKVPVVKHGINGHLRQKGKVAELACVAEGQKVLTDVGLVPIENVTRNMKVWDGTQWVNHDGVVCRGEKEVITYEGLTGTADHIVWAKVKGEPRTICLGDAAACGAHLICTGAGRLPLWLGKDYQPGEAVERRDEPLLCADRMHRMRLRTMAESRQPSIRKVKGLSKMHATTRCSNMALQAFHRGKTAMHKSERPELSELRRKRHPVLLSIRKCRLSIHDRSKWLAIERHGAGSDQYRWQLRARKSSVGAASNESSKSAPNHSAQLESSKVALCPVGSNAQTFTRSNSRTDNRGCQKSCRGEAQRLANNRRTARVFDIINAGPHHRFTVSDVLVHNCGYGGGVNALIAFGADEMGLTDDEMQEIVTSWRESSPMIVQLWRRVEDAARRAIENPGRRVTVMRKYRDAARAAQNEALTGRGGYSPDFLAGGAVCTYYRDKDALRCKLPSGRILSYWQPGIGEDGIQFMGQNQTTRKWESTKTWGGRLVENIVQAYARDCLAVAMTRLDAEGWKICFHVHDEVIVEAPDGSRWEDVAGVMGRPIEWAPGLLLRADGYTTKFYMKD